MKYISKRISNASLAKFNYKVNRLHLPFSS